jgi:hypothetical protein
MDIYRVQDDEGYGPYAGRQDIDGALWQEEPHGETTATPGPMSDPGLNSWYASPDFDLSEWKFGFLNMAQLNAWFTPYELIRLKQLGFSIVKLNAYDVKASEKQAVYRGIIK